MSLAASLSRVFAWTSFGIIALLAAASAEAGRPRSMVLDQDTIAITHDVEFESWANLVLMRSPAGEALVVETRPDAPVVVRRLGLPIPPSGVEARYVEAPDGTLFAALVYREQPSSPFGVRVFRFCECDIGIHEVGHWMGVTDPGSVQLGIIAVLIGLAHEPVETVGLAYGVALEEIVLAYEGVTGTFRPVEPQGGGWIFGDD